MSWSLIVPNLLIGLREGFEAGLIVTILLGAVRRLAPERRVAGVWLGVTGAAAVSLSLGAVLTFSRAELSPRAQEGFAGALSLVAVVLVTAMIFWMRRTARTVSGDLRGKVSAALAGGGVALGLTAFVAVAREGLETALFVWTNAQAAGRSGGPLLGALIGLLVSAALCALLYQRVLKINLSRFFAVTGAGLVVIVSGVLAYGLGELQSTGLLPGRQIVAFDVSGSVSNASWWAQAMRGVFNLDTRMTWLQVLAYLGYLVTTMSLFLAGGSTPDSSPAPRRPADLAPTLVGARDPRAVGSNRRKRRRLIALTAGVAVLPVAVATLWVAADRQPGAGSGAAAIFLSNGTCVPDWAVSALGQSTYLVTNNATTAADVELVQSGTAAVLAEIEVLGPGTSRQLAVTLPAGQYSWQCRYDGGDVIVSPRRTVSGTVASGNSASLVPATREMLAPALAAYRNYVGGQLVLLGGQVGDLQRWVAGGDRVRAQQAWLAAHLTYRRVGAAYDAFGAQGSAIDGLAQGLPAGASDPAFSGFHRIEQELWSSRAVVAALPAARALTRATAGLGAKLDAFTLEPNDVTIRTHEILEDTSRFTLTGQDDFGSGSGFAAAQADLDGTQTLVRLLSPLLEPRSPGLTSAIAAQISSLRTALRSAGSVPVLRAPAAVHQRVNAAAGHLLETLAPVPDLLEVRA